MANPFTIEPPNVLQALMLGKQAFGEAQQQGRQAQQDAARRAAENTLMTGGDIKAAFARLIGAGDIAGAKAASEMELARTTSDWNRYHQGETLKLAQQTANRPPEAVRIAREAGLEPGTEAYRNALVPKVTNLSPTEMQAINKAENEVPQLEATIANIKRAKELNPMVFSGIGAGLRGTLGAKLPDKMVPDFIADPSRAAATSEWDQIMGMAAIQNMSETLKGSSTNLEMQKFLNIAADTSQPVKVRENAMNRFLSLAEAERDLRKRRVTEIRGKTYYKPGGGASGDGGGAPEQPNQMRRPQPAELQNARRAIQAGATRDAVIQRLRENGISAEGL